MRKPANRATLLCNATAGMLAFIATFLVCGQLLAQDKAKQTAEALATRQYTVALGFQRKGLYDQAEVRWNKFIKDHPQHSRLAMAIHHLGVSQLQQKKFPQAIATFRDLQAKHPKFSALDSAQFNLALAYFNLAETSKKPVDFQTAVAAFQELVTKYAKSKLVDRALYYQAECLCLAGKFDQAIPVYRRIIKDHPKSTLIPQAHYSLGATLQDMNKDVDAVATMRNFIKSFPKDPLISDTRLRLGNSLLRQQKYTEAEREFAQAAADKTFVSADVAHYQRARCQFEQKKDAPAAVLYEELARKFPKSALIGPAWLSGGKCRFRARQYPQAANALRRSMAVKGEHGSEAGYWLGQTLLAQKQPGPALTELDRAIKLFPNGDHVVDCRFTQLEAMLSLPARHKAGVAGMAQFAAQFANHPKAPFALYQAASGAFQLDDFASARSRALAFLANKAFAKHELLPLATVLAAECHLQAPLNAARAEQLFRQVLTVHPKHDACQQANVGVAAALYAQRKLDPAIQHVTATLASLKTPELRAEALLIQGRSHFDAGRAKNAISILRTAISAKPNWTHADEALLALAKSLHATAQFAPAITELNKLNGQFPKSVFRDRALYQLGLSYQATKNYPQATAHFQRVTAEHAKSPMVPAALYGLAAIRYEEQKLQEALPFLNTIVTKYAKSPVVIDGLFLRGMTHLALKAHAPAVADLNAALARNPAAPRPSEIRLAIARAYSGLKQPANAIAALQVVQKTDPTFTQLDEVYYELAFAYLDNKDEKQAVATFRDLVAKLPKSTRVAEAWYRIGELQEKAQQTADALTAYTNGLKASTSPAVREKLHYRLGALQFTQKQLPAAIAALESQLREVPQGELAAAARFLIAEAVYQQKDFRRALSLYAAIAADGQESAKAFHARSIYRCGTCTDNLNEWANSQKHYADLIQKFPKFEQLSEARYGLGIAYQKQNKFPDAIGVFTQITAVESDTLTAAKSWFMKGQCHFSLKKYQEAVDCFSEVAFGFKHDEWQPLSYFEAGRCYIQLKKKEAARKMLTAVVKEFPKHPRANDAKTILAQLDKP